MRKLLIIAATGAALTTGIVPVYAGQTADPPAVVTTEKTPQTSIPFANLNIRDWRASERDALYIQSTGRDWYKAELMGSCSGLPFAESIGFVIDPTDHFDRFSAIVVSGQICHVKSLVKSEAPKKKKGAVNEQHD